MGWVVCEMTGHANKLHHFWLNGQGQCHAICQLGGVMGAGMNGPHFHVVPSKTDPPLLLKPPRS